MLVAIVVILLLCIILAPGMAFNHPYGYWPSGGLGLLLLILIVLAFV